MWQLRHCLCFSFCFKYMSCRQISCSLHTVLTLAPCKACHPLHIGSDDMHEDERQLWTEQILQWMCSPNSSTEIRFACGQALTGACESAPLPMHPCTRVVCTAALMLPTKLQHLLDNSLLQLEPMCRASICLRYRRPTDCSQVARRFAGVLLQGCDCI